jgi:hypothetical protein
MEIELPTKITEIIVILTFMGTGIGMGHNALKKLHVLLDRLFEKISSIEKRLLKLEEKVDENEKNTKSSFEKMNDSIMDIKVTNGKLESSFGFIKDGIQCQRLTKEHWNE